MSDDLAAAPPFINLSVRTPDSSADSPRDDKVIQLKQSPDSEHKDSGADHHESNNDDIDDGSFAVQLRNIQKRLQSLLLDDYEEPSIERLEFLLTCLECGVRGEHLLISEDIIEFIWYLLDDEYESKAVQLFIEKFDHHFESVSDVGSLKRPQIGDLLIDAFSDLVIVFVERIHSESSSATATSPSSSVDNIKGMEDKCMNMIRLIGITTQMCVLRHGFTRLFQMYHWCLSMNKSQQRGMESAPLSPNLVDFDSHYSYPSSPKGNIASLKSNKASPFNTKLANLFLDMLIEGVSMTGPEIYLSSCYPDVVVDGDGDDGGDTDIQQQQHTNNINRTGLYPMVHIKSRLSKGWSFTSWMRLSKDQVDGTYNILSFEGLLRVSIRITVIAQLSHTVSCSLIVELLNSGRLSNSRKQYTLSDKDLNVSLGRWHFVCFTHDVTSKQDNFCIYVDGKAVETLLSVPYPNFSTLNSNGIFPLHIGGYLGDIGQSFIYEIALNSVTVSALNCVGPTYSPPIYNRNNDNSAAMNASNYFDRCAAFPRSVRQRAAPMQPRKSGYLLLPFCYGLNPRAVSEVLCLPYGWGYIDICDRKNNLKIVSIPHNKSSLISLGGICYAFYWLSPEFNGATIASDEQGYNILRFLNELIANNLTLLRQLFTMGLSSIKVYILKHIRPNHRTHLILNCIKELLIIIKNCDQDARKQYFVDGFLNIVMDSSYWIKAPPNVQNMLASFIHTSIETDAKVMVHCLSLTMLFDMIRTFFPNSFRKDAKGGLSWSRQTSVDSTSYAQTSPAKVPTDADARVAQKLLESAASLVRLRPATVKYSAHRSIALLIAKCSNKELRCQILSAYAEMCYHAPNIMFAQMSQKSGVLKILWDVLQEKDGDVHLNPSSAQNKIMTDTRVRTAKILMSFIQYQGSLSSIAGPAPVGYGSRSGYVNKSALDELVYQIGLALGVLPPSVASYVSLLEIVLGKFKLNMSASATGTASYTTERIMVDSYGDPILESEPPPSDDATSPHMNGGDNSQRGKPRLTNIPSSFLALVADKDQINFERSLEGLMSLLSTSSYRLRTRMLMDILSLVKTSEHNQKLFCRQRNDWDSWMVRLVSLDVHNDDANACNQLVSQIAATIIWRYVIKDDKGWIYVMQLLETLNRKILQLIKAGQNKQQNEQQQREPASPPDVESPPNEEQNNSNPGTQSISAETQSKCRVLHEFLVQVLVLVLNQFLMDQLRSSDHDTASKQSGSSNSSSMNDLSDTSENLKNRTSKNLVFILDIAEWVLFNHRFSMLSIPRIRLKPDAKESDVTAHMLFDTKDTESEYHGEEIRNEILLLKRLLSCTLKFISFKNERQLVLRRLLRYLKEIFPHMACDLMFDDCINAAREFIGRMQSGGENVHTHKRGKSSKATKISVKNENNMKTMRIAYSFLKNAYLRFSRRVDAASVLKAAAIRALQQEVYAFWGPMLFEDKIDPNTAHQMDLSLSVAETQLENVQHHIHSLWVFLQHQKWWEYQFQDKNMKRFKVEYGSHEKEDNKKILGNREQFDKFQAQCHHSFDTISSDELQRVIETKNYARKKKRDVNRDLKKYMDFYDEDFQSRFPHENTPDFWELDPRESGNNHTRLLLVRNFKGTNHDHAAVQLTHARRRKSKTLQLHGSSLTSNKNNLRRISNAIESDLKNSQRFLVQTSELDQVQEVVEDEQSAAETATAPSKPQPPSHERTVGSMESVATTNTEEYNLTLEIEENNGNENENENEDEKNGFEFDSEDDDDDNDDNAEDDDEDSDIDAVGGDGGMTRRKTEKYLTANLSGKKVLLEVEATSISPFFKISGKMYITEQQLIFEGHEYLENVHEQNAADQIKLRKQKYDRERKTLQKGDELLIKQLDSENKQHEKIILAQKELQQSNIHNIIEYEAWALAHIKHLHPRRYLLRENGLEIWIAGTAKSFFFTFTNTRKRGDVISVICKNAPRFIKSNASKDLLTNSQKMLRHIGLTEKWQKRKISNFDYLMELNVLAGRSYNDVTQYPVFPWVLTDFESAELNLNDASVYRDLSKPIGALNENRLQTYIQRYHDSVLEQEELANSNDPNIQQFPPFYYGSHYMSAGIALYYLCRIEPFATLYINLHGGRFEIPDRTFYSMQNAWDLSLNNMGDVKELIPEMFYFPEFLRNINQFPLGYRTNAVESSSATVGSSEVDDDDDHSNSQRGTRDTAATDDPDHGKIDHVTLPPWCNNSPEEFVRIMKQALESDYVSDRLNHWIDLIFGYKQRGPESVAAHNVFFYLTYSGAVDPDSISDPTIKAATEQQIYHFGQTPDTLFHQPHPQRMAKERCHWLCELHLPFEMDTELELAMQHVGANSSRPTTPTLTPTRQHTPQHSAGNSSMLLPSSGFPDTLQIVPSNGNQAQAQVIRNKPFIICQFKPVEQPSHLNIIRNGQCLKLFDTTERLLTFELPILAYLDPTQPNKSTQLRNLIDVSGSQMPPDLPVFELMPPDWSDSIVYNTFVISSNGLYGITAGYLDCSIKVHLLKDGSTLCSLTGLENGHNDIVTCLALDETSQDMLISGAKDGSIVYWSAMLRHQSSFASASSPSGGGGSGGSLNHNSAAATTPQRGVSLIGKPYRLLSVHYDAVRVIAVNSKIGIIVSAADDGTIALYSIARKRFVRELLFEGREHVNKCESNPNSGSCKSLHEVIKIHISDTGYIVVHSLDNTIPYLRVLSLNGILIKKLKLDEILFCMKSDSTGKILITGGQSCTILFRHIHNLALIQELSIIPEDCHHRPSRKLAKPRRSKIAKKPHHIKKPNQSKKINAITIHNALLGDTRKTYSRTQVSHSSSWRQQRFPYLKTGGHGRQHSRQPSINDELFGQRKSVLNNKRNEQLQSEEQQQQKEKKKNKNKRHSMPGSSKRNSLLSHGGHKNNNNYDSPRLSTHFHGRFASVDGDAILSQSRIIDFDLDPDNTYIVIVLLNLDPKYTENQHKAQLLLYPLPNTRHIHQFDKFVHCANKVLQTAKNTIWENIINVIESENGLNELKSFGSPVIAPPSVSELYFKDNLAASNASSQSVSGKALVTGKNLISKIKLKTNKFKDKDKDKQKTEGEKKPSRFQRKNNNKQEPLLDTANSEQQRQPNGNESENASQLQNGNAATDNGANQNESSNEQNEESGSAISEKFSAFKSLWKK